MNISKLLLPLIEVGIFLIGIWVRVQRTWWEPALLDEMWTQRIISINWRRLFLGLDYLENKHQIYYLMIKPLAYLSPYLELQRLSSVLFGALTMLLGYFFLRKSFGRRVAIVWMSFVSVSPVLIVYDSMLRSYGLMGLLMVSQLWIYREFLEKKTPDYSRFQYGSLLLILGLSFWLHSFMLVIAWSWSMWFLYHLRIQTFKRVKLLCVFLMLSIVPIYRAFFQVSNPEQVALSWLDQWGLGTREFLQQFSMWATAMPYPKAWVGALMILCVPFLLTKAQSGFEQFVVRGTVVLAAVTLVLSVVSDSLGKKVLMIRYVIVLFPMMYLIIALSIDRLFNFRIQLVAPLAAGFVILGGYCFKTKKYSVMVGAREFTNSIHALSSDSQSPPGPLLIYPSYVHYFYWRRRDLKPPTGTLNVDMVNPLLPDLPPSLSLVVCEPYVPYTESALESIQKKFEQTFTKGEAVCDSACCRTKLDQI